ncbi:RNA polymerase-binding transcription factor DksA [Novimethylophilus kurashikiensis]|uniref:RNA polymerase-binding transcription factor DksA n=1 Tax=Novimethylophilus kurashikiensis TaxID=1825523 RepID=A0A2R5FAD3_9PROT|nr:TraR/DksA family transcriptional regulator [Novimethylophilus kurashikiensis]GBG15190.1 RNA polymerase-binding transcription factor DksA [Novimethylophilus kurashikiensis]
MSNLTELQKQQIAQAIQERKQALREDIRDELARSGQERFADLAGEVADAGDASVADLLMDENMTLVSRQVQEFSELETAQQRLDTPEFGECAECGSEIGFQRLLAAPNATRCIDCQSQHEKTFAHSEAPRL